MSPLSKAKRLIEEAWRDADIWHDRQIAARSLLKAAVADAPEDPALLTAYGTVLCDLNEYAEAATVLEKAIRLGSADRNTYFALAVVAFNIPVPYKNPGTFRRARTLFKKASTLTSSPSTWEAYFDFQAQ